MGDSGGAGGRGGRRRRIALFTNNYLPRVSGVAVAVDFLERALRRAGHRTLVVAPDYGFDGAGAAPLVRRVRSIPLRRVGAAIPLPRLDRPLRSVARFRPDVLHAHHPFSLGRAAVTAADVLGVPLVYTFHTLYESFLGPLGLDRSVIRRGMRAYVRRFVARCDLVVAPTEPVRRLLVDELGVTVPTAVAPTGLDRERFAPLEPPARAAIRAELGLGDRTLLLAWAGRVTTEKSPELALDTLAELVARGHDARLVFLGDGPSVGALADAARRGGLEPRVRFAGFVGQERLPRALAAADVFLFTSYNDTQGIVGYEAWASGLPIVAVPSMAGRAVVEPGSNGLLAEPDAGAFAQAVEHLGARPELGRTPFPWHRLGAEALAARWDAIYADAALLGRRAKAPLAPGPSPSFTRGAGTRLQEPSRERTAPLAGHPALERAAPWGARSPGGP